MKHKYISLASLCKSLYFDLHYFGAKGFKLPVLIDSRVKIGKLGRRGDLEVAPQKGRVYLGLPLENYNIYTRPGGLFYQEPGSHIVFKGSAIIRGGFSLETFESGELTIGASFFANANLKLLCEKTITIGNDCTVGWDVDITDRDGHKIYENGLRSNENRPIVVGNHVWICSHCVFLKGAIIPDDCVLGACSLISSKLDSSSTLYAGSPARFVKAIEKWEI
jgi:acetyltransferase-like isoleucine patch superfamily enzyme